MPWPNDVVTRTVTGTYYTSAGDAAVGRVTFTPTARIVDIDDNVIIEETITAVLDNLGTFEIDLPTTDNAALFPEGWAYTVNIRLYGVKPQKFLAFLPEGDGSDVDLNQELSGTSPVLDTGVPQAVAGPIGPRGPGTIIGEGLPTYDVGFDGDIYIDTETGNYYGPKTAGEWSGVPFFVAGATGRYIHTQASPSSEWAITHSLGGRPSVTVVDSSGTVVIGEIAYNSNTSVTVRFTAPFSGYAYLT